MLEIENLKTNFNTYDGVVKALDGVNLKIEDGEIFGLVGETGSGKSVTCYSALKLLPKAGEIVDGTVKLNGEIIASSDKITDGTNYASFGSRFVAQIIDSLIIFLFGLPILIYGTDMLFFAVILSVLNLLYYVYFDSSKYKATPGKMFKGLVINGPNGRLTVYEALLRSLLKILSGIFTLGTIFSLIFFSDKREGLHDKFCKSHVISQSKQVNDDRRIREIRGGEIGIIFQDPLSALNPVMTVNEQIGEILVLHQNKEIQDLASEKGIPIYKSEKWKASPGVEFTIMAFCISFISLFVMLGQWGFSLPFLFVILLMFFRDYVQKDNPVSALDLMVIDALSRVKLPNPEQIAHSYPHELSGGMQQRVMIAMALAGKAKMLIADEPTTALDVTIQAQILQLIKDIQKEENMSVLLITHDLGVVAETCERVAVMYKGKIVEEASVDEIFTNPKNDYTKGLLNAIPKGGKERLKVPNLEEVGTS